MKTLFKILVFVLVLCALACVGIRYGTTDMAEKIINEHLIKNGIDIEDFEYKTAYINPVTKTLVILGLQDQVIYVHKTKIRSVHEDANDVSLTMSFYDIYGNDNGYFYKIKEFSVKDLKLSKEVIYDLVNGYDIDIDDIRGLGKAYIKGVSLNEYGVEYFSLQDAGFNGPFEFGVIPSKTTSFLNGLVFTVSDDTKTHVFTISKIRQTSTYSEKDKKYEAVCDIASDKMFNAKLNYKLNNMPAEYSFKSYNDLMSIFSGAELSEFKFDYKDYALVNHVFDTLEKTAGITKAQAIDALKSFQTHASEYMENSDALVASLIDFVNKPDKFTITTDNAVPLTSDDDNPIDFINALKIGVKINNNEPVSITFKSDPFEELYNYYDIDDN